MYDKDIACHILKQVQHSVEIILSRFQPVKEVPTLLILQMGWKNLWEFRGHEPNCLFNSVSCPWYSIFCQYPEITAIHSLLAILIARR